MWVSNPNVPAERTPETGVHIVRFLTGASVEAYLDQQDREERGPEWAGYPVTWGDEG